MSKHKEIPDGGRGVALVESDHWLWLPVWLVAGAAAVMWWRLAPAGDVAGVASAFLLGTAWWLTSAGRRLSRPRVSAGRWVALVIALGALWLLTRASTADFWVVRLFPPVALMAATGALGGLRPIGAAGSAVFALVVWMAWPESLGRLAWIDGRWLSELTARWAAGLLWIGGVDTQAEGNVIVMPKGQVEVLVPCTALPLVQSLLHTLIPAALALRLSIRRTLGAWLLLAPVSFVVSVVRTAWLAIIADEPERFAYWHGGEGGAIFTGVALVGIGWFMLEGMRLPAWWGERQAGPVGRLAWGFRLSAWLLVGGALLVAVSPPREYARLRPSLAWTPPTGWKAAPARVWVFDESKRDAQHPVAECAEWRLYSPAGEARVVLGYLPEHLGGSVNSLLYFQGFDGERVLTAEPVAVPATGWEVLTTEGAGGRWWVTALDASGVSRPSAEAWAAGLRASWFQPARWVALLSGVRPLRDKRALWVAVAWPPQSSREGPVPSEEIGALLKSIGVQQERLLASGLAR